MTPRRLGDIIDGNETEERTQQDFLQVAGHFDRLRSDRPTHHVLGNHCLAIARPQLYQALHLTAPYYSFSLQGWRFLVLDAVDMSVKWPEDTPNHQMAKKWLEEHLLLEKAQFWNGGFLAEQLRWLETNLAEADSRGEKVLLFSHIPVAEGAATAKHLIFNDEEVFAILDQHSSVFAWLSGHFHQGGYTLRKGVHHVTFEAVLEAPLEKNSYGVIELYDEKAVISGHGVLTSRTLMKEKH